MCLLEDRIVIVTEWNLGHSRMNDEIRAILVRSGGRRVWQRRSKRVSVFRS
jgi:hypothetical protein